MTPGLSGWTEGTAKWMAAATPKAAKVVRMACKPEEWRVAMELWLVGWGGGWLVRVVCGWSGWLVGWWVGLVVGFGCQVVGVGRGGV